MPSTRKSLFSSVSAAATVLLLLTACSTGPSGADEYPPAARDNFISSCVTQPGASESMCEDCFELVADEYTYDEFVELDTAIRAGTATREDSDRLASIIKSCS